MEDKIKILIAEDDENLGSILKEFLTMKGYETDLAPDGEAALAQFKQKNSDVCVLDVMMPKKDGFTLAKEIRELDSAVPIIFLTAKSMLGDKAEGFKAGADDYMTKPFSAEELLMRINAVLRRAKNQEETVKEVNLYKLGKYKFDYKKRLLVIKGTERKLTSKETELLKLLCEKKNGVVERAAALRKVWGDDTYFTARSMDVYIVKLRNYLKEDPSLEIVNVHGLGFKLIEG